MSYFYKCKTCNLVKKYKSYAAARKAMYKHLDKYHSGQQVGIVGYINRDIWHNYKDFTWYRLFYAWQGIFKTLQYFLENAWNLNKLRKTSQV